jgi:uncharacterized membrane-anchored protein
MYQPGGLIIVYVSIRVNVSLIVYASIIVDVSLGVTLSLIHLIDIYTKINPPD